MSDDPRSCPDPANVPERAGLSAAPALVSRRALAFALGSILVTCVVFGLFPDLDLNTARLFYSGSGHFIGQNPAGVVLRHAFALAPFAILGLMLILALARSAGRTVPWAPRWRGIAFLAVSLAVGPGLLVNTVLKDHSHRPRPAQITAFGGALPFRPFYSFDGGCRRNCSFVSGEGSAAFWTVGAALLLPARIQPVALAGALVFGVAASVLRLAFGGHFLSDTIFAALLVWIVVIASWRAFLHGRAEGCRKTVIKPIVNHVERRSRRG